MFIVALAIIGQISLAVMDAFPALIGLNRFSDVQQQHGVVINDEIQCCNAFIRRRTLPKVDVALLQLKRVNALWVWFLRRNGIAKQIDLLRRRGKLDPLLEINDANFPAHQGLGAHFGREMIDSIALGLPLLGSGKKRKLVSQNRYPEMRVSRTQRRRNGLEIPSKLDPSLVSFERSLVPDMQLPGGTDSASSWPREMVQTLVDDGARLTYHWQLRDEISSTPYAGFREGIYAIVPLYQLAFSTLCGSVLCR